MSYIYKHCTRCGDELSLSEMGLEKKLELLHKGTFVLPGSPPGLRKEIGFSAMCDVCRACMHAVVDIEVKLQDLPGDDPDTIGRRTRLIVDAVVPIWETFADARPHLTARMVGERLQKISKGERDSRRPRQVD